MTTETTSATAGVEELYAAVRQIPVGASIARVRLGAHGEYVGHQDVAVKIASDRWEVDPLGTGTRFACADRAIVSCLAAAEDPETLLVPGPTVDPDALVASFESLGRAFGRMAAALRSLGAAFQNFREA